MYIKVLSNETFLDVSLNDLNSEDLKKKDNNIINVIFFKSSISLI